MTTIIAAVAKNMTIGKNDDLPWHLPEDLKHFKRLTLNNTVLMGRKTYESIVNRLGKPLPKRTNIVITRNTDYQVPAGTFVYNSIENALTKHQDDHIFVIGGATIYKQTIDLADELEITHLDENFEGDTFFPEIDMDKWKVAEEEKFDGYRFVKYIRK